jgi:DNA-binding CsgD family transcriptional regulator
MSAAATTAEIWLHDESELGAAVRDVAHRMAAAVGAVRGRRAAVVREVRLADAAYRVRGGVLPGEEAGQPAIVVMLERVDELPSEGSLRERFGLTRSEARVARLLATGLTNAELAAELSISPHTARHHTESVLAKLSVPSRRAVRERLQETVPLTH